MSLRISLRDGEKMIVNGAVLRATGRTQFVIENHVAILRDREVMSPEEATTPARRLYFACMMAYIDSSNLAEHQDLIVERLRDLFGALESEEARAACIRFAGLVALPDFYRALAECRTLINYEAEALARFQEQAA
jgi:flagellar protein FlbT